MSAIPFEDSRRLTGANLFFAAAAAVLEVVHAALDDDLIAAWRLRVGRAGVRLGWTDRQTVARRHATGVSLAIAAPYDQLFLATEVNEWALCASLQERDAVRWPDLESALQAEALRAAEHSPNPSAQIPPVMEESAALRRFERLAACESNLPLRALIGAAATRGLAHVIDESQLTLGAGRHGHSFSLSALPDVADVEWTALQNIPTAMVTGSNGKTTTVRLIAACARAHGWQTGYNCTDGVFVGDEALAGGDYSGPAGARMVMRDRRAQAAVIETARGGILRRGIAVSRVDAAVVTNVSADHFGEYGIDDLDGLAQVKLAVASVVAPDGLLVLNADDPVLRIHAADITRRFGRSPPLAWFSAQPDSHRLQEYRSDGASSCGARAGRLYLNHRGGADDLGAIVDMPLSMNGIATYNIGNLAGAALAARALGIAPATIAAVFARFGADIEDNPGRMMRFEVRGVRILIDYAHNPDGLQGLLSVAEHFRGGKGRLALMLGQAGNRSDDDIRQLAQIAMPYRPDLVIVKENANQLRGRAPGEVPAVIREELLRLGLLESALLLAGDELQAARLALDWALPGDTLVLPVHSSSARRSILATLQQ